MGIVTAPHSQGSCEGSARMNESYFPPTPRTAALVNFLGFPSPTPSHSSAADVFFTAHPFLTPKPSAQFPLAETFFRIPVWAWMPPLIMCPLALPTPIKMCTSLSICTRLYYPFVPLHITTRNSNFTLFSPELYTSWGSSDAFHLTLPPFLAPSNDLYMISTPFHCNYYPTPSDSLGPQPFSNFHNTACKKILPTQILNVTFILKLFSPKYLWHRRKIPLIIRFPLH